MHKLIVIRQFKSKIIIALFMTFLLGLVCNIIFIEFVYNAHPKSVAKNTLYTEQTVVEDNAYPVVSYTRDDDIVTLIRENSLPTGFEIPFKGIEFSSDKLALEINELINRNTLTVTPMISFIDFVAEQSKLSMPNENTGIDYLLAGSYPKEEYEVLISELTASYLISKSSDDITYPDLINQSIDIYDTPFKVVGVYAGESANFYANYTDTIAELFAEEEIGYDLNQATILTFDNHQQMRNYINQHPDVKFIKRGEFWLSHLANYFSLFCLIILLVVIALLLKPDITMAASILNVYSYNKFTAFNLMFINLSMVTLVYLITF